MNAEEMMDASEQALKAASAALEAPRGNWELARIKAEIGSGYARLAVAAIAIGRRD
jgi:hypothetical protein